MIQEFYGLELDAFSLSPDLDFLFLSHVHEEAVAHLLYGLEQNEDIILIVGDIGTGKTLALHRLITQISSAFKPVSINVTTMDFEQLLRLILLKLDFDAKADTPLASLIDGFEKILIKTRDQGKKVLLIVDEAQNLTLEVLESLRLLMNLAQPGGQALQMVLVGQLGLRANMNLAEMRQLRQRIRVDYQFGFLNRQEVEDYVLHRLKTSGRTEPLFHKKALDRIFSLSQGVPRVVNILASKALLAGYVEESKVITSRHLDDISLDDLLDMPQLVPASTEGPTIKPAEPGPEPEMITVRVQENLSSESAWSDPPETEDPRRRGNKRWLIGAVFLLVVIAGAASFLVWGPTIRFDFHDGVGLEVSGDPVPTQPASKSITTQPELSAQTTDPVSSSPDEVMDEEIATTAGANVEAVPVPPPSHDQEFAVADENFLVHVASFRVLGRGVNFSTQLKFNGVDSFVRQATTHDGKVWYRVYLGPYPTRKMAREIAKELKGKGWIQYSRITTPDPKWERN